MIDFLRFLINKKNRRRKNMQKLLDKVKQLDDEDEILWRVAALKIAEGCIIFMSVSFVQDLKLAYLHGQIDYVVKTRKKIL